MPLTNLSLPWILLGVSGGAHALVILLLAAHRRDWRDAGKAYFFVWQTWDIRTYTEAGRRLYKWLPITAAAVVVSAVLAFVTF
jgi:hypothetical protein